MAEGATGCLGDLQVASRTLDRSGFVDRPSRRGTATRHPTANLLQQLSLASGNVAGSDYSSSSSEYHFRESAVLTQSCAADQANLRSHSGPCQCGALRVTHVATVHREATPLPHHHPLLPVSAEKTKYVELLESDRRQLVVVGIETGGRIGSSQDAPLALRRATGHFAGLWSRLLTIS